MIDQSLYLIARALVCLVTLLPITVVAVTGRSIGRLVFWMDARHRNVALENLKLCFGEEKSREEIRGIALENFCRIGESFSCAVKTAFMPDDLLSRRIEISGSENFRDLPGSRPPRNRIAVTGHFGNFELCVRIVKTLPGYRPAATYRGVRPGFLNRILLSMRTGSGCRMFDRRTDAKELRQLMEEGNVLLGIFVDQRKRRGLKIPFFGADCFTSTAAYVMARRYGATLNPLFCYRTGLAKWRLEAEPEVLLYDNGRLRSKEEVMTEINQILEKAIRRDPANWFWVHRRWDAGRTGKRASRTERFQTIGLESPGSVTGLSPSPD